MTGGQIVRYAVLIPAYRPSNTLMELVRSLQANGCPAIVVVDDGSGAEYADVFAAVAGEGVELLRHESNRGKGAALKTGLQFARERFPEALGVVTADADGQHHPADIARVAEAFARGRGESLILGARAFQGEVPLRSRIGNSLTAALVHLLLGRKLRDTQTGLRGIPASLIPQLLEIEATGYEFELEMLVLAHRAGVPVVEEPIRTIYEAGNASSHFNPLIDSFRIYFVLFRFASVSLATAALDNVVFYLAYRRTGHVLASQALGRAVAVSFNYWMVRRPVFGSRQRTRDTLPKYLALVVVSGAASYGGIRLLGATLGMAPIVAKLLVESALFFVNFSVQRLLIFRVAPARREIPGRWWAIALWTILAAAVALEVYGFANANLFAQHIWNTTGIERFWRYVRLFAVFSAVVLALAPRIYLPVIAAIVVIGSTLAAGPLAVAATLLFLLSAWTVGSRFVEDKLLAILAGTSVYMLLMLALSRVPVHSGAAWACLLALPILFDARRIAGEIRAGIGVRRTWNPGGFGDRAALALAAMVAGTHWLVALKPETSADGLAMHLAIPTHIAAHHAFTLDPARILWAVMPMGADWIYSIVYLMGGELATHMINVAMLVVLLALLYTAARRSASRAAALLAVALFASTPIVQLVTGSLFVENILAALVLGMFTAVWRLADTGRIRYLYLAALLAGAALTTKLAAMPFVILAVPFALMEARRHRKRARECLLALALLAAAGLPSYALAWWKTANPVFPFLNQTFRSKVLDPAVILRDARFRQPLTAHTPFDLTFRTSDFYEGQNGSAGFQYLLLAPLAALALVGLRRRPLVCAASIGLAAAAVVLSSEPNVRYLYAAMPLLSIPFAAWLTWTRADRPVLYAALVTAAIAAIGLNCYFLPASGWYHKDFYAHYEFRPGGQERFIQEDAPTRAVIRHYNREHPNGTLLLTADADFADPRGTVYENIWHQYDTWIAIQSASALPDVRAFVDARKIEYFIGRFAADGSKGGGRPLRQFLESCTHTEYEHGGVYLARLNPACNSESPAVTVGAGEYDDFDAAIRYTGDWFHTDQFPQACKQTVSYTDGAGAEATLLFEGEALTYRFTRAPNRGIAEITVDGASKGTLDLYSPVAQWQSTWKIAGLGAGHHTATIRVTGTASGAATGRYVDLDAFIVE